MVPGTPKEDAILILILVAGTGVFGQLDATKTCTVENGGICSKRLMLLKWQELVLFQPLKPALLIPKAVFGFPVNSTVDRLS